MGGIGGAIAENFASSGSTVVVADIDDDAGAEISLIDGIFYMHCDVSVQSDIERVCSSTISRHGGIGVLVNNVGVQFDDGKVCACIRLVCGALIHHTASRRPSMNWTQGCGSASFKLICALNKPSSN